MTNKKEIPLITLGDLRAHLSAYPDDYNVSFGGLHFYRVKQRAPELIHIEFNEIVYLNEQGDVVVDNPG